MLSVIDTLLMIVNTVVILTHVKKVKPQVHIATFAFFHHHTDSEVKFNNFHVLLCILKIPLKDP